MALSHEGWEGVTGSRQCDNMCLRYETNLKYIGMG